MYVVCMMQMCRRGTRNLAANARSRDPANLRAMLISCDSYLRCVHNDYVSVPTYIYIHSVQTLREHVAMLLSICGRLDSILFCG